jgi:hypothetical protein
VEQGDPEQENAMTTPLRVACAIVLLSVLVGGIPVSRAGDAKGPITPLPEVFVAHLSGNQETPNPVVTPALGLGVVTLDALAGTISVRLRFSGLTSNQSMGHIHGPAAAGSPANVIFNIGSQGTTFGNFADLSFPITPQQIADLRAGLHYFNVHTQNFGGGEIRGQILPETLFEAFTIDGAQEFPNPIVTPAGGFGFVTLNQAENQIRVSLTYSGLTSNQTLGHIHGPAPAGANANILFNIGSSGTTSGTFANLTFPITAPQVQNLRAGQFYFNVHTMTNGGGEIRGQIDGVLRDGVE